MKWKIAPVPKLVRKGVVRRFFGWVKRVTCSAGGAESAGLAVWVAAISVSVEPEKRRRQGIYSYNIYVDIIG
jgi:hypothetical protein